MKKEPGNLHRPTLYIDGATVKLKNSRVSFREQEDGAIVLSFCIIDNDKRGVTKSRAEHKIFKGKVVRTSLKLSAEAMRSLAVLYVQYVNHKMSGAIKKSAEAIKKRKADKEDDQESKILKDQFNFKSVSPDVHDDHP